jgi:hypothetical protein
MVHRLLADFVLTLHLGFVLFVVLGGLLLWRWPRLLWLHAPAFAWAAAIELGGWVCPLTPLESRLRMLGGEAGYAGGFIEHHLVALLYPEALTRELQYSLGALVLALNGGIYALLAMRWHRRAHR